MRKLLITDILRKRWSPYSFSSEPVEEYKLKAIISAARFAPSSNNYQPWMFVYITREDEEVFNDYLGFLNDSNRVWAKNAYVLLISLANTTIKPNGKINKYAFHDTGMAVTNMLLQAIEMEVYVHQMGGFSVRKVKEYLKLDRETEPVAMMAIGKLGNNSSLPAELLKRDKKRRPRKKVNDFIFEGSLDNPVQWNDPD